MVVVDRRIAEVGNYTELTGTMTFGFFSFFSVVRRISEFWIFYGFRLHSLDCSFGFAFRFLDFLLVFAALFPCASALGTRK